MISLASRKSYAVKRPYSNDDAFGAEIGHVFNGGVWSEQEHELLSPSFKGPTGGLHSIATQLSTFLANHVPIFVTLQPR